MVPVGFVLPAGDVAAWPFLQKCFIFKNVRPLKAKQTCFLYACVGFHPRIRRPFVGVPENHLENFGYVGRYFEPLTSKSQIPKRDYPQH